LFGQTRALKVVGVVVGMRAGNEKAAAILVASGARFDWSVARGHHTGGCTRRRLRSKAASALPSALRDPVSGITSARPLTPSIDDGWWMLMGACAGRRRPLSLALSCVKVLNANRYDDTQNYNNNNNNALHNNL
jgi:hypothetical protein